MHDSPNKLSQFWQEFKRRKVIYVITVYASAAFVIIELVNNVVEPLNLPERTPTIAIIVLAIGFPIAVILSWIFDLTPKGVEKTKPLTEGQVEERPAVQNRWKIATYVSIAVIIGLIMINLVGGPTRLKAGDIQSLVVLPFENFTGDDQLEYFVSGMHFSLIGDIGKIGGLKVISKTSSDVYKDVDMSVPQITSELNVDVVVEAAVMCLGEDSVCVQFKLITPDETQIWIADYKEAKSQILNLYTRVTQ
jgi:TolB-like protein